MTPRSPVGLRASRFVTPTSTLQGVLAFVETDIRRDAEDKYKRALSRHAVLQHIGTRTLNVTGH